MLINDILKMLVKLRVLLEKYVLRTMLSCSQPGHAECTEATASLQQIKCSFFNFNCAM